MMAAKATAPTRRGQGEGGISKGKDGRVLVRVELPRNVDTGERRYKSQRLPRGTTDLEARTALHKLRVSLANHGDLPTGSESVTKWMAYWLDSIDKSRPRTRAGYRSKIGYIDEAIGNIKLDKLLPADVRKLEHHIVVKKGLSSTSALQTYQILAKALKDAEREGRVTRNVARLVDPPRKAVPKLAILTTEQAVTVIGSVVGQRLGSRTAAALLTGARQGELLGLEWDRVRFAGDDSTIDLSWQLQRVAWSHGCGGTCGRKRGTDCPQKRLDAPADWEHRWLTGGLYLSRPKSKAGWREIPLVEPLLGIMQRRHAASLTEPNPHGLVWTADPKRVKSSRAILPLDGSPIDPSRDNDAWHQVLADCGLEDSTIVKGKRVVTKRIRLHDARHTAVTLLFDMGVAETVIQDIVGQSTIATTRGYRHKNTRLQREAMQSIGAALSPHLVAPPNLPALPPAA